MKLRLRQILQSLYLRMARYRLRRNVQEYLENDSQPLKVVIGSGDIPFEGWLLTDVPVLDVLNLSHWRAIFPESTIDRMLAEHVFEHLTEAQFVTFLNNVRPYLAPQGRIRIAVPDGFNPSETYVQNVSPGGAGVGADDHKVLYTYQTMTAILNACGYMHELLEYFDENGQFHHVLWDKSDGMIRRSIKHDPRNQDGELNYTSLIVDVFEGDGA